MTRERLVGVGDLPLGTALLGRIFAQKVEQAEVYDAWRAALQPWLAAKDEHRAYAALWLAEIGLFDAATLPDLAALLAAADDLTRYRTRRVINDTYPASRLGQAFIETAAQGAQAATEVQVSTYLGWMLRDIEHDQPPWLAAWAAAAPYGPTAVWVKALA